VQGKSSKVDRIDTIHKHPNGTYADQGGRALDIKQVFNAGRLHCFSGKNHPLIVTEWNVARAMFFVIGEFTRLLPPHFRHQITRKKTTINPRSITFLLMLAALVWLMLAV
jgi:hypothetical protein